MRKRAKFDENNLDWLIGDLRKEEAQLVITRLSKELGEEPIRKQIDIVRHAREQYTADQIRQQVEFFAQLRKLQETPAFIRTPVFDSDMSSVLMTPMQGQGMMETPVAASRHPPLSNARIKGIQSRISNAFKKEGKIFHIQVSVTEIYFI